MDNQELEVLVDNQELVVVEWRVGRTIHRVRTNGPIEVARRAADAAGWKSVVVFEATTKDAGLPYVYELGDEDE